MKEFNDFDPHVKHQGDEPLVAFGGVARALERVHAGEPIGTAADCSTRAWPPIPTASKWWWSRRARRVFLPSADPLRSGRHGSGHLPQQRRRVRLHARGAGALGSGSRRTEERWERLEQAAAAAARHPDRRGTVRGGPGAGSDTADDLRAVEAVLARQLGEVSR